MLNIKILGPGCYNCHLLERITVITLEGLRAEGQAVDTTITRVKHLSEMEPYAIRLTPGLVINEQLVCAGRVPSEEEVSNWLRAAIGPGGVI
jgi:hypothetical protein